MFAVRSPLSAERERLKGPPCVVAAEADDVAEGTEEEEEVVVVMLEGGWNCDTGAVHVLSGEAWEGGRW